MAEFMLYWRLSGLPLICLAPDAIAVHKKLRELARSMSDRLYNFFQADIFYLCLGISVPWDIYALG